MYYYLIPVFQSVLSEIRNLLANSNDIISAEGSYYNSLNDSNFNWSWDNFYKYFSLNGLHLCDSFIQNIAQVPDKNYYYNFYSGKSFQFSKTCQ